MNAILTTYGHPGHCESDGLLVSHRLPWLTSGGPCQLGALVRNELDLVLCQPLAPARSFVHAMSKLKRVHVV